MLAQSRGRHLEFSSYTQQFLPSSLPSADSRQIVSPDDSCLSLVVNGRCEIEYRQTDLFSSDQCLNFGNSKLCINKNVKIDFPQLLPE